MLGFFLFFFEEAKQHINVGQQQQQYSQTTAHKNKSEKQLALCTEGKTNVINTSGHVSFNIEGL